MPCSWHFAAESFGGPLSKTAQKLGELLELVLNHVFSLELIEQLSRRHGRLVLADVRLVDVVQACAWSWTLRVHCQKRFADNTDGSLIAAAA